MSSDWNFPPIDWIESEEYGLYGIKEIIYYDHIVPFYGFYFVDCTEGHIFYGALKEWCEENFDKDRYDLGTISLWTDEHDCFYLSVHAEYAIAVKLKWG